MKHKSVVFMVVLVVLQLYASVWALPATSYDEGEFFRVDGRKIHLLRSLQKVAVCYIPSQETAIMRNLEVTREMEHPYHLDSKIRGQGIMTLQVEKLESLGDLKECIYQLERRPGIERAVPVYIHEESGLEVICTDQFIVKLAAGATLTDLDAINKRMGTAVVRRLRGSTDQFILEFPHCTAEELLATCEAYWHEPGIEWAEPDFLGQVVERDFNPNDPLYPRQWHLNNTGQSGGTAGADINAREAWSTTTGSNQIIIAILDDGVDLEHEDLKQNIASNPKEQPGDANGDGRPGIANVDDDGDGLIDEDSWGSEPGDIWYTNDLVDDDDENGYIDDCGGWDFFDSDNNPNPVDVNDNHGTTVAGPAAAKGNNGIGVAGCAFDCKLMPLKVIRGDFYYSSGVAEAIQYAAGIGVDGRGRWRGADVLNISLGLSETNSINNALIAANTQGRSGKGCPIFCAVRQDGEAIPVSAWTSYTLSGFSSGSYTFTWEYEKNGSGSGGDDAVWIDDVVFPGGVTEGFEGSFPPNGWEREGDAYWTSYGVPNRVLGTGKKSARSGVIGNNQITRLETTRWVESGSLNFYAWVSSQPGDVFRFKVNGTEYFTEDGDLGVNSDLGYPENHSATIAVGASTSFDYHWEHSSYGEGLDFVAPGNDIWTTDRMGSAGYASWNDEYSNYVAESGTSYASSLAAGVAALMLSKNSELTADEVRSVMQQTCRKIGDVVYGANGLNEYYGYGCIDAGAAVDAIRTTNVVSPNVLICGAETYDDRLSDIQQKLLDTGQFNTVDTINVKDMTPTLEELHAYDAILVYMNASYHDPTALGNAMADYVDSGGGVVCTMFEVAASATMMQGRWSSEQYYAIPRGSVQYGPQATLGTVHDPGHPIMQGVSTFDGGHRSYRPRTFDVMSGAVRVADWSDGRPLVVTKMVSGVRRVDLGFYPVSSDVDSDYWDSSTDGTLLMANALNWVARAATDTLMPLPEFSETFSDSTLTRGYWFEAPTNFRITGFRVPDEAGNGRQNVEVVRFNNQTPPPNHPATTNAFVSLARFVDEPSSNILSVSIPVSTGDIIGILGAAGTSTMYNSYGIAGDFVSNIGGRSVTLKRMGMQLNLYENHAQNLWQKVGGQVGRVEMWYIVD
jgi:subtilisin family serine protease